MLVVVDVSRSMRASAAPGRPTRFTRAQRAAVEIRDALPEVPTGIASLTDRVLPHLFPTADRDVFVETVERALRPEQPAPAERSVQATALGALAGVPSGNVFDPSARRRLLVVVTDGESRPFDPASIRRVLAAARIGLVVVRVGDEAERVYDHGRPEAGYVPDPLAGEAVAALAGENAFAERDAADAARAARDLLGRGPTVERERARRLVPLGPYLALLALLPLALLLRLPGFRWTPAAG